MPKRSAGILLFRRAATGGDPRTAGEVEVLLVHPGGPIWAKRDDGAWSIPKGELEEGESALAAAEREVEEELGDPPPEGPRLMLGEVVQGGGKHVDAWAVEGELDAGSIRSGTFTMEWPPGSGTRREFPEVDRAEWFSVTVARTKLVPAQGAFIDRLLTILDAAGDRPPDR